MKTLLTLLFTLGSILSAVAADPQAEWFKQVPEKLRKDPAFAYVEDDPKLPRVLLIGDSISIGYTPATRELLAGKANVHRVPENAGSTVTGLEKLQRWLGSGKWDVIHFNWGLHDLKYWKGTGANGKLDLSGTQVSSLEAYEKNLRQLVEELKKTGAKLVWASTTPVPEGSAGRIAGDDRRYNEVAARVMSVAGVRVNDLNGAVSPRLGEFQLPLNVHFKTEGSRFLGERVATAISEQLSSLAAK